MIPFLALLALLALPLPIASQHTSFDISGVITCNLYPRFSYIVEIYEHSKEITYPNAHLHVSVASTTPFSVHVDNIKHRKFFDIEVFLLIHHDCTKGRAHKTYRLDVGKYQPIVGTYPIKIDFDVNEKGDKLSWPWPTRITEYH